MDLQFVSHATNLHCKASINNVFPEFISVQLLRSGSMFFKKGDNHPIHIHTPTFFWTDMVHHYVYHPGPTGFWSHNWIAFNGELAKQYYHPILMELAPDGHVPLQDDQNTFDAFAKLSQSIELNHSPHHRIHLLNQLLFEVDDAKQSHLSSVSEFQAIIDLIHRKPEVNHDFEQLARDMGYSYSHFRRLFKQRYRVSPHKHLLQRRMTVASKLLCESSESIADIALQMGYQDPARFSRVFKEHYQISPKDFKAKTQFHILNNPSN